MTTHEGLNPEVMQAVEEIGAQFPDTQLVVRPDGDGGAYVIVESVTLSDTYVQSETWIGFRITFAYPDADVYPHFVRRDLLRTDGSAHGEGFSPKEFEDRPAQQLSRRSHHRDLSIDTALIKLLKVLEWLNNNH